jgi:two-component system chemotaxis sensor kinase CheA
MANDIMQQMRGTFRAEALDLLIELDSALLALEETPADSSLVHRVFRAIHTIKGSGGTAGFAHLARFAHKMEEAFDLARDGRLAVTPDLIDCGLKACDVIRLIIEIPTEDKGDGAAVSGEDAVASAFQRLLPKAKQPKTASVSEAKLPAGNRTAFEITFKPKREMFYSGADPVTLLDDLRSLGAAHVTARADQVPSLTALEPEHCYLWWEIVVVTTNDEAAIKEVFVFAEDDCELRVRLLEDQAAAIALFGAVPADTLELFVVECEDHLESIENDALLLEKDPASKQRLDSLFRSIHTIKGNTGVLLGYVKDGILDADHPLQLLFRVAHGLESFLDTFRQATAEPVTADTMQVALESCDAIRTLLGNVMQRGAAAALSPQLLKRLSVKSATPQRMPVPADGSQDRNEAFFSVTAQSIEMISGCCQRLEEGAEATRPMLQTWLRGIKTLSAAAQYRHCPELSEPVAQQLRILDAAISSGDPLGSEDRSVLGRAFGETRSVLNRLAAADAGAPAVAAESVAVPQEAAKEKTTNPDAAAAHPATIRIEQNKIDRLMRIVGELLVARGAFPHLIQKLNDGSPAGAILKDVKEAGSNISRIADELQAGVMSIRMLPVKTVFQKFPRMVRDLARSLGKEVRFVIEGDGIELDKTILEQIGDPLVHVIRNAVDHGLEPPSERLACGKEAAGQLRLRAFYEGAGVSIEISEDGRGLNAAALKRKAVEKGLLDLDTAASMSDEAAFQLVFMPGLSTAAKVTDVSGRGVGMDVVRSNVRNLQGSIEIKSKAGVGTTFLIKLPASLMVSKGILLRAGGQEYILPLSNIQDMVKLPAARVHSYRGLTLAQVRGQIYPLFSLSEVLGLTAAESTEISIAIVKAGTASYGLIVDRFLTEVEVLVKPLAGRLEQCKEFQGAAIMGDGGVVLVLNVLELHTLEGAACN